MGKPSSRPQKLGTGQSLALGASVGDSGLWAALHQLGVVDALPGRSHSALGNRLNRDKLAA